MVVHGVELVMSRRQISAMILADPVNVVFRRKTKVEVAGGGWRYGSEVSLPPQQVRLTPFKRRMTNQQVNTEIGDVVDLPYVLLGRHTLDIEKGDVFSWKDQEFKVESLDIGEPEVKISAHVDYFGGGVNG